MHYIDENFKLQRSKILVKNKYVKYIVSPHIKKRLISFYRNFDLKEPFLGKNGFKILMKVHDTFLQQGNIF